MCRACPTCTHILPGKPRLKYSLLVALDGNNSLKHLAQKGKDGAVKLRDRPDNRTLDDGLYMGADEVNKFDFKNAVEVEAEVSSQAPIHKSNNDDCSLCKRMLIALMKRMGVLHLAVSAGAI